jgi:formylmethanofuran dehydrogenase subunit E
MAHVEDLEVFLKRALEFHGHVCSGQSLGYRMVIAGLREAGIVTPEQRDNAVAFVEVGGCIADAIQIAAGITLGHGTLKFYDYGKFAATFLNSDTSEAVRVAQLKDANDYALAFAKERGWTTKELGEISEDERAKLMVRAYGEMPEDRIFTIRKVRVNVPREDMERGYKNLAICSSCGEMVFMHREIVKDGKAYCRSCLQGSYYSFED